MTDRTDDPPSSDELIERARRGLSNPDSGDPAATTPSDPDTPAPPSAPAAFEPAPHKPAPSEPASYEPASYEPASYEPASHEPASHEPPVAAPDSAPDDSGSMLPDDFSPQAPAPAPARSRSGPKWGWIVGTVVLGVVAFNFFTADTSVEDLSIGDCFMAPSGEEIDTVETADCADLHDYEVFGFVQLSGASSSFPGDDVLFNQAGEGCFDPFLNYLDISLATLDDDLLFDYDVFIPVEASWEAGDREAMCALYAVDAAFVPISSTGSARGG